MFAIADLLRKQGESIVGGVPRRGSKVQKMEWKSRFESVFIIVPNNSKQSFRIVLDLLATGMVECRL